MVVCPMPLSNQMESRIVRKIEMLKKNKTKLAKSRGAERVCGFGGLANAPLKSNGKYQKKI